MDTEFYNYVEEIIKKIHVSIFTHEAVSFTDVDKNNFTPME